MIRLCNAVAVGAAAIVAVAGCGGDDDTSSTVGGIEQAADDAGQEPVESDDADSAPAGVPEGFDFAEGFPLADGLIPELASIPIPDGPVAFGVGSAYDEDVDPRQTAVQGLFFTAPPEEIVVYYLEQLPAAGFVLEGGNGAITDPAEVQPGVSTLLHFQTPDGLPGQMIIGPGFDAATQVNVNVFRSGIR